MTLEHGIAGIARGTRRAAVNGAVAALLLALAPNSAAEAGKKTDKMAGVPQLIELIPPSGAAGEAYPLTVTIRGTGFAPTGNTVEFGPVKISDLPSPDAGRIDLAVPKSIAGRGAAPPAVLPPGDYQVTVTTAAGTSNALVFTLTRGP